MELISRMNMIHATTSSRSSKLVEFTRKPTRSRVSIRRHARFSVHSKSSGFQDFGSYAKVLRLLPATEVRRCTEFSPDNIMGPFKVENDKWVYKVKLRTSDVYGSGLSDINAGIVICLIDKNGDSILQRVPAVTAKDYLTHSEDTNLSDDLHFQTGYVDEFTFEGSKMGMIEALWVGVESGQWRLGGASLTTLHLFQSREDQADKNNVLYEGLQYDFQFDDISLGEGSHISVTELRPSSITELSGSDPCALLTKTFSQETSLPSYRISNEETMSEYEDLKLSLLLYDAMLIILGTAIAQLSGGESTALAFLGGGVIGFLYLFLLERSVDGLPAPTSSSTNAVENFGEMFEGFKSPVAGLALAVGLVAVGLKYGCTGCSCWGEFSEGRDVFTPGSGFFVGGCRYFEAGAEIFFPVIVTGSSASSDDKNE